MAGRFMVDAVFRSVDRFTRPVRRMQAQVRSFGTTTIRVFRRVAAAGARMGSVITRRALGPLSRLAALLGVGSLGGGAVAVVMLNQATVEANLLAQAVGVSSDLLEGIAAKIRPAGFELEHVVDLIEEMNNKFGESSALEQTLPVQEALAILGLQFEELRRLRPEEQFRKITNAAIKLGDAQQAASAFDILLGGEANKVLGVLRSQNQTVEEMVESYKLLNFQTEESRKGAADFTKEWGEAAIMFRTFSSLVAGIAGKHLAPFLRRLTDWVKINKELISSRVVEFIEDMARKLPAMIEGFQEWSKSAPRLWQGLKDLGAILGLLLKVIGTVITGWAMLFELFSEDVRNAEKKWGDLVDSMVEKFNKLKEVVLLVVEAVKEFMGFDEAAFDKLKNFGGRLVDTAKEGGFLGLGFRDKEEDAAAQPKPQARGPVQREQDSKTTTSETTTNEVVVSMAPTLKAQMRGPQGRGVSLRQTGAFTQ